LAVLTMEGYLMITVAWLKTARVLLFMIAFFLSYSTKEEK